MKKLVYGVGINDAEYVVQYCLYYRRWKEVLRRCYSSQYHINNSSYVDCIICEEWKVFSNFKTWMMNQDWKEKELDKDILNPGNKVYSPETCVFVDREVNQIFSKKNKHGVFGVSYCERINKYILRSSTLGGKKAKYSGCYSTLEEAKKVSNQMRCNYLLSVASKQNDKRIKEAILSLVSDSE
jgi:hypothetical protein